MLPFSFRVRQEHVRGGDRDRPRAQVDKEDARALQSARWPDQSLGEPQQRRRVGHRLAEEQINQGLLLLELLARHAVSCPGLVHPSPRSCDREFTGAPPLTRVKRSSRARRPLPQLKRRPAAAESRRARRLPRKWHLFGTDARFRMNQPRQVRRTSKCPRRDLNPCYQRERLVSLANLDDGDPSHARTGQRHQSQGGGVAGRQNDDRLARRCYLPPRTMRSVSKISSGMSM